MKPLRPVTALLYQRTLQQATGRSFPLDEGLAPFAGLPLNYKEMSEQMRVLLRAAVRRAWGEAGDEPRGIAERLKIIPGEKSIKRVRRVPFGQDRKRLDHAVAKAPAKIRVIFLLLVKLGLRVSELLSVSREEITRAISTERLRVLRKGGKEQLISVKKVQPLLDELLRLPRPERRGASAEEVLDRVADPALARWQFVYQVLTSTDLHEAYNAFNRAVHRLGKEAALDDPDFAPHITRHIFATGLHRAGVDMPRIQRLLGHSDPGSTLGYITMDPDDLADAMPD